ncbi:DUF4286 family protein [Cupriavidus sp. IK-TO18]|uniref:DUF4286 family protein n=1 Tax=Cupriavidus sp. IK-TO18 TaxID=2782182 RepID=UPI001898A163|nr:DUF4286 family protein [Cupriavidus sp. IK-TO18]MBF6990827.1 hypothetical protein [Cupriavidus sp. IK-TO18]
MNIDLDTPPGMLLLMHDVPAEIDEEFNRWYPDEHFAERLALPGFQSVRRYRAVGGQPTYMVIYRCDSIMGFLSPAYRHVLENPTPRTKNILMRFQNVVRATCRETWRSSNAIGGCMIVVQCKAIEGKEEIARNFIKGKLAESLVRSGGMVTMSLCESDAEITSSSNSDIVRRGMPNHYADWVILVEGYDPVRLSLALHQEVLRCDSQRDGLLLGSLTRYELMCLYEADAELKQRAQGQ